MANLADHLAIAHGLVSDLVIDEEFFVHQVVPLWPQLQPFASREPHDLSSGWGGQRGGA